jgi:ATP-dependent protease ClpP protease subunit
MSIKQIKSETDRDTYITPEAALEKGIIDEILKGDK